MRDRLGIEQIPQILENCNPTEDHVGRNIGEAWYIRIEQPFTTIGKLFLQQTLVN